MEINYEIRHVGSHYEVYVNGQRYCTADTMQEAIQELRKGGYA